VFYIQSYTTQNYDYTTTRVCVFRTAQTMCPRTSYSELLWQIHRQKTEREITHTHTITLTSTVSVPIFSLTLCDVCWLQPDVYFLLWSYGQAMGHTDVQTTREQHLMPVTQLDDGTVNGVTCHSTTVSRTYLNRQCI